MQKHLEEISRSIAAKAHGFIIMDGAGWRKSSELKVPEKPLDPFSGKTVHCTLFFSRKPAALFARVEPNREYLAVLAPNLPFQPRVRELGGHRRCLLRCLEPPDR